MTTTKTETDDDQRQDCEALHETVSRLRVNVEKEATRIAELLKHVSELERNVKTYLKEPTIDEKKVKTFADTWRVLDTMYERQEDLAAHNARCDREAKEAEERESATRKRMNEARAVIERILRNVPGS